MTTASSNNHNANSPVVSVIVPAYCVAEYIGEAINSVFGQTFTDYEIIVVNDGSPDTDELERSLEPHRERIVYLKQKNAGVSAARNSAINVARGRYLALLDPDDFWEPDYLAVTVGKLDADRTIDAFYPNAFLIGDPLNTGKTYMDLCPSEGLVSFESLISERCQVPIFATVRTEIVKRAGMFDESLRISQDFDLWLRIVKLGGRIAYTRRVLVHRRRRPEGLSSNEIALCQDIIRIMDKAALIFDLNSAERKVLETEQSRRRALLELCLGKQAFLDGNVKMALHHLTLANGSLRSPKLEAIIITLRAAPRLLVRVHEARERLRAMGSRRIDKGLPSPSK